MNPVHALPSAEIRSHHALRGIAALLVVVYHMKDVARDQAARLDGATSFFSLGYLWVDFFFILSGFIMCHVYGRRLGASRASGPERRRFLIARIARIYPLHLVSLLLLLALELIALAVRPGVASELGTAKLSALAFAANLVMLHGWGLLASDTSWNIPSWSISTEMACYLAFPWLAGIGAQRAAGSRAAVWLSCAVALFTAVFVQAPSVEDVQPLLRCSAGFILGMGLHALATSRPWLSSNLQAGLAQSAALAAVVLGMHHAVPQPYLIAAFAGLIFVTCADRGYLGRLAGQPVLQRLGELSFSVYLTHWLVYRLYWLGGDVLFAPLASRYSSLNVALAKLVVLAGLVVALAMASYRWIEMPARAWVRSLLERRLLAHA